jgi:hypothetical protein
LDFIKKYGQEEPFNKELAEDPPDIVDDDDDDDPTNTPQSEDEAAENAVLFTKLRTVSEIFKLTLQNLDCFAEA